MKRIHYLLILIFLSACNCITGGPDRRTTVQTFSAAEKQKTFAARRQLLMDKTGNSVIVIRSDYGFSGGRHQFRAASNFYYLTGYDKPGSLLILDPGNKNRYTLYIRGKSINEAIFTGEVPQTSELMNEFQPDTVLNLEQSDQVIADAVRKGIPVYTDFADDRFNNFVKNLTGQTMGNENLIRNIAPVLNEMRVVKDSLEISEIRKAVDITGDGILQACNICKPGMNEYEIEAIIEYTFRKENSTMPAFQSIVGSGPHSTELHYSLNNRQMQNGELLLMDIGAEYAYYCGDITRTIPVGGKFSKEQREIYELVLRSQKAAIDEMKPGNYLIAGHNASTRIIARGLFELGLITDTASVWQKKFYILYPISHFLGMEVHDAGDYGVTFGEMIENMTRDKEYGRRLEKGMVLTIEPGLYFRSNGLSQIPDLFGKEATSEEIRDFLEKVAPVYEKYKNIGIRIEDDILITEKGCEVLSGRFPKEIHDIERSM